VPWTIKNKVYDENVFLIMGDYWYLIKKVIFNSCEIFDVEKNMERTS
jgi:hypothetical protein